MKSVLLTVSGNIPDDIHKQITQGLRPEADYLALARAMDADLIDYRAARKETGRMGRWMERFGGPNLLLAWACFQRSPRYQVIFTDGEQVGMPLALLWKVLRSRNRPQHVMIAHYLSVRKKILVLDLLRLFQQMDTFIVYSTWQKAFIERRWGIPAERVFFTPFMVDAEFFHPQGEKAGITRNGIFEELNIPADQQVICSAGLEFRDYPTLLKAVEGLDVQVVIAAASPWSKRKDSTRGQDLPPNVLVRGFSQFELRELYARSQIVVMPLYPVTFQAGVTAILEAMAMGKAVICTRTPGQTDIIEEGVTGCYVPAGDAQALREAIQYLLENPEALQRIGAAARRQVEVEFGLTHYAKRLAEQLEMAQERTEGVQAIKV